MSFSKINASGRSSESRLCTANTQAMSRLWCANNAQAIEMIIVEAAVKIGSRIMLDTGV